MPFLKKCSKKGMQACVIGRHRSCTNLRWAWNGNGLKLLAFINFNKNMQEFYKNFEIIIIAPDSQLGCLGNNIGKNETYLFLKMGKVVCQETTGSFGHFK